MVLGKADEISLLKATPTYARNDSGTFTGFTSGKTYLMMLGAFAGGGSDKLTGGCQVLKDLSSVFTVVYDSHRVYEWLTVAIVKATSSTITYMPGSGIKMIAYIQLD